jgi:hypothetical protein
MAVSLARKIKRIGMLPSTTNDTGKVTRNFDGISNEGRQARIAELKQEHKLTRVGYFAALPTPGREHRRSKKRTKAGKGK